MSNEMASKILALIVAFLGGGTTVFFFGMKMMTLALKHSPLLRAQVMSTLNRLDRDNILVDATLREIGDNAARVEFNAEYTSPLLRWSVVGIYTGGEQQGKPFSVIIAAQTPHEARNEIVHGFKSMGIPVDVIACVTDGGVSHLFSDETWTE